MARWQAEFQRGRRFGARWGVAVLVALLASTGASSAVGASVPKASAPSTNLFLAASSGVAGASSSMAFTPTADPTLAAQLDNQQGSDADSTIYSQGFVPSSSGPVNTITWWGTGSSQVGFMVALHDGLSPALGSTAILPNGPAVDGTLAALAIVPIAQVTQTPAAGGQTEYQIQIPATLVVSTREYRLSVTAIGGSFAWDNATSGGRSSVEWVRGRLKSYLAWNDVAFSIDNVGPSTPVVTTQPIAASAVVGSPYSFTAAGTGTPTPSVQWQASTDGGATYHDVAGATSPTLTGTATSTQVGKALAFRAVFSSPGGSVTTSSASLAVISSSQITLTASRTSSLVVGQSITLRATVVSGIAKPTGTVTFADGSTVIGRVTLAGGKATMAASFATVGRHTLTATYGGSGIASSASSTSLSEDVASARTATSLTGPASAKAGLQLVLTIAVKTVKPGTTAPTGSVSISDGTSVIATVSLGAGGTASAALSSLGRGSHSLTATYAGDGTHATSLATKVVRIS